jgi:hypothetical protein
MQGRGRSEVLQIEDICDGQMPAMEGANGDFLQQTFAHDIQFLKVRQLTVLSNRP